jgi:geranylgeranyl reductase family protein
MIPSEVQTLIVGAGPAGATTSLFLEQRGIDHLVIDKAVFPRDKICGDALSGKVVDILGQLDIDLIAELEQREEIFMPCYGISFIAPNGKALEIPFRTRVQDKLTAAGFISRRVDFDHYLVQKIKPERLQQGCELVKAERNEAGYRCVLRVAGVEQVVQARFLVSAEGERSLVAKQFAGYQKQKAHYSAGIRSYYTGITGCHPGNYIELHFLKDLLPGYLWIFPLPDGRFNVGVGMSSTSISKKKVNLKQVLDRAIVEIPALAERFQHAKAEGPTQGWGLPLGSKKWPLSGDGFILTGDAGSLIDPFTGEGIGNAMKTGMLAAQHIESCVKADRWDAAWNKNYERAVYDDLWDELKIGTTLQRLTNYPWLFNFVVNKSLKNKTLRDTISCMFDDISMRDQMRDPRFYFKILFN